MRPLRISLLLLPLLVWTELLLAQNYTLTEANKLYRRRDYTSALLVIEEVLQQKEHASNPDAWYFKMKIHDQLTNEAYSHADTVLYTQELVNAYHKTIAYDKDNRVVSKAKNLMKRKALYFKHKANFELNKEKTVEFIKAQELYIFCQNAIGLPDQIAVLDLAIAYQNNNQLSEALATYMELVNDNFNTEATVKSIMDMLRDANMQEAADSIFDIVLKKYPDNVAFKLIEINDLISRELYFKARNTINEVLPSNSKNAELHYLLGLSNIRLNLLEDGISELETAINVQSNHYEANFETGKYYLNEGVSRGDKSLLEKAKVRLERCEIINPDEEQLLELLRDLYLEVRDLENYQRINDKLDN